MTATISSSGPATAHRPERAEPSRYNVEATLDDGNLAIANTLHNQLLEIDAPSWKVLHDDWATADPALRDYVIEAGYFVADRDAELSSVLAFAEAERTRTDTLELTIAPTIGCNLRCTYCPEGDKRPEWMTEQDQADLLRFVDTKLVGVSNLTVTWFGGEPLLKPDLVVGLSARLSRLCTARGVIYNASIITNGTRLTDPLCQRLRRAGITAARITIDGPQETHDLLRPTARGNGSFDASVSGAKTAQQYFETSIGVNVGRANVRHIPKLLDQLASLGLGDVTVFFARIFDTDGGSLNLSVAQYAAHEARLYVYARSVGLKIPRASVAPQGTPCSAVKPNHFVIEPSGEVKRCYAEVTDAAAASGTIGGGAFEAAKPNAKWMDYELDDDGCEQCAFLPICQGGCPKLRMNQLDKERDICTPRKFNMAQLVASGLW